jgi:hypothetical protein
VNGGAERFAAGRLLPCSRFDAHPHFVLIFSDSLLKVSGS